MAQLRDNQKHIVLDDAFIKRNISRVVILFILWIKCTRASSIKVFGVEMPDVKMHFRLFSTEMLLMASDIKGNIIREIYYKIITFTIIDSLQSQMKQHWHEVDIQRMESHKFEKNKITKNKSLAGWLYFSNQIKKKRITNMFTKNKLISEEVFLML